MFEIISLGVLYGYDDSRITTIQKVGEDLIMGTDKAIIQIGAGGCVVKATGPVPLHIPC
jgi:hypothetical protein